MFVAHLLQDDFLKLDLEGAEFSSVDGVLLDPSCSGSGTTHTQLDRLLSPSGASFPITGGCHVWIPDIQSSQ